VLFVFSASLAGAQGRPSQGGGASDCQQALVDRFDSLDTNTLDEETIDAILLLREEEKLARDVYITQDELDAILASPMETGVIYDENGDVLAECGRGSER
jgi:hypothetical protein